MNINTNWSLIRKHFNRSFSSNFHVSVGSVGSDGIPTVTPIGTLFLNDDLTGFYFEKFPAKLPVHAVHKTMVCLLGVYSSRLFWFKSLFVNRFEKHPAIKLYGKLGARRKASSTEIQRLNRRMKFTRGLKGNTYLWKNMEFVREIQFVNADKINLGVMTQHLE